MPRSRNHARITFPYSQLTSRTSSCHKNLLLWSQYRASPHTLCREVIEKKSQAQWCKIKTTAINIKSEFATAAAPNNLKYKWLTPGTTRYISTYARARTNSRKTRGWLSHSTVRSKTSQCIRNLETFPPKYQKNWAMMGLSRLRIYPVWMQ